MNIYISVIRYWHQKNRIKLHIKDLFHSLKKIKFYEHLCLWYFPEEDELRLRVLQDQNLNGTARSKHTARGQPAPPVPQEEPSPQTPPQTQTQPKAQTRGRPPPPPEEDEENPPPLPRPRNKQQRKRHEEPYRPMEWDACMFTERQKHGVLMESFSWMNEFGHVLTLMFSKLV